MSTDLAVIDDAQVVSSTSLAVRPVQRPGEMTVQAIVERKRKVRDVLDQVMVADTHYGKIPGCGDKPTLLKPGAEVLAMTFGLAPRFRITKTELGNGHREVDVVCTLVQISTGAELGDGIGSCSTMEKKYRWRGGGDRKCPECGAATVLKSKQDGGWFCWQKKGGCGAKWPKGEPAIESQETGRAENPDIADTYNTVLKMAKKRAQVDATLTVLGASDFLAQDLEDVDDIDDQQGYRGGGDLPRQDQRQRGGGQQRQTQSRQQHVSRAEAAAWAGNVADSIPGDRPPVTESQPEHDVIVQKLIVEVAKADDIRIGEICEGQQAKLLPEEHKAKLRTAIRARRQEIKAQAQQPTDGAAA